MAVVMNPSTSVGSSWEDQIVPTLRKRLEHESAYLSNRLSSNSFQDAYRDPPSPSPGSTAIAFPEADTGRHTTSLPPSRIPTSPRSRTKSTHLSGRQALTIDTAATAGPSSQRRPGSSTAQQNDGNSGLPRSRIPTRPRSKSQLAPRPPGPVHSNSNPPPPMPSGLPRPSSSRRGSSPTKNRPEVGRNRSGSPELRNDRTVEGLVKNELPPFVLYPEDAMRIAERGHDLDSDDDGGIGYSGPGRNEREGLSRSVGGSDERDGKRQRTVTMGPELRASMDDQRGLSGSRSSARAESIGLGVPSSSLRKSAANRSASNRNPQAAQATSQAPRSASLNLIASSSMGTPSSGSSSRLGVAAHFVPPENTYTPPKGANWDEVVLPAVAKKLGINEPERMEGEEGDLAVEWDKDGTPIKWVKRSALSTSHSSQFPLRDAPNNTTPTHSAFSPTFEPSPNNPLRHQASLHAPSMRHKQSGDSLELRPIRAPQGPYADLTCEPPESPAPFSNYAPMPADYKPVPSRHESEASAPTLSRKPSLLQRVTGQASQRSLRSAANAHARAESYGPSGPIAPGGQFVQYPMSSGFGQPTGLPNDTWRPEQTWNRPGQMSMPSPQRYGSAQGTQGRPVGLDQAGPMRGQGQQAYGGQAGQMRRSGQANQGGQGGRGAQGAQGHKREESVGKGCGCVIM